MLLESVRMSDTAALLRILVRAPSNKEYAHAVLDAAFERRRNMPSGVNLQTV
jgi:hypothetical protein